MHGFVARELLHKGFEPEQCMSHQPGLKVCTETVTHFRCRHFAKCMSVTGIGPWQPCYRQVAILKTHPLPCTSGLGNQQVSHWALALPKGHHLQRLPCCHPCAGSVLDARYIEKIIKISSPLCT